MFSDAQGGWGSCMEFPGRDHGGVEIGHREEFPSLELFY